jgi:glycosyltransferase involved in cell wall biosynthesis
MKISVITVCFNAAEHIDETLRSVVMQDHGPVEHIVIDGGSTDGTQERIGRYREVIAHFVTEPDKGVYDAMNKGLRLATGEVIAFVNAGDMIAHRSCLSEMAAEFAKGDADAIYGDAYMVDPKDIRKVKRFWKGGVYKREAFRSGWMPPHLGTYIRKEVYDRFGHFRDGSARERGLRTDVPLPLQTQASGCAIRPESFGALPARRSEQPFVCACLAR